MLLGLAQGHSVYGLTTDFAPSSYIINNTTYTDKNLRAVYSNPVIQDIVETQSGTYEYIWNTSVSITTPFSGDSGTYQVYCVSSFDMQMPSNVQVVQARIKNYNSTEGWSTSLYSFNFSGSANKVSAYFRTMQNNAVLNTSNAYRYNLVTFDLEVVTQANVQPSLTFSNISSAIRFSSQMTYEEMIIDAINNSQSAEDIADILVNSGLTLAQVRNISTQLGVANTTLSYIQEYAFLIWEILDSTLSSDTETDFAQAETKVEDLVGNLQQYQPHKPNSEQIQTDAQSRYMSMQAEENNNNIFFYLSFQFILPIILLVFTFAILSYILYGGK